MDTKKCSNLTCGLEFTPKVSFQKFCSFNCKRLQNRRDWAPLHREQLRDSVNRHYWRNRAAELERNRKRYKDKERERSRKYAKNNPDKALVRARRYNNTTWGKIINGERTRRHGNIYAKNYTLRKKTSTPASEALTRQDWDNLIKEYKGACAYCGRISKLTQDHVIPISKGGKHIRDNVVPACFSCNRKKSNLPLGVFLSRMGICG
jgi:5-methylcytosine-specific restriction endonuclease McrA